MLSDRDATLDLVQLRDVRASLVVQARPVRLTTVSRGSLPRRERWIDSDRSVDQRDLLVEVADLCLKLCARLLEVLDSELASYIDVGVRIRIDGVSRELRAATLGAAED